MLLTTYQVASKAVEGDKWAVMIFFVLIVIGFMATLFMQACGYGIEVLQTHKDDDDVDALQEVREGAKDKGVS